MDVVCKIYKVEDVVYQRYEVYDKWFEFPLSNHRANTPECCIDRVVWYCKSKGLLTVTEEELTKKLHEAFKIAEKEFKCH